MNNAVQKRFDEYPITARVRLEQIRNLIFCLAEERLLGEVEESLKWGEPSYRVKTGSPIRMDWKPTSPEQYLLLFHCQTQLIETFRELYGEVLEFQGNRAIVFNISQPIPEITVKHCLELALTYKQRKHLPLLGV